MRCPSCKLEVVRFRHFVNFIHGTNAYEAGTEHFICPECDYQLTPAEAREQKLVYTYDTEYNHEPKHETPPQTVEQSRVSEDKTRSRPRKESRRNKTGKKAKRGNVDVA